MGFIHVYNVFGSCPLLLPSPVSLPFLLDSFFPASPSDTFTSFAECLKLNEFKEGCLQAPSQQPQPLKTPLHPVATIIGYSSGRGVAS